MTISRLVDQTERDAILNAHDAAVAEHERLEAATGQRLGLPQMEKLASRMWRRLIRYVERLAEMRPTSAAGLAAKASVLVVIADHDLDTDWWGRNLSHSLADDAVRLGRGGAA